MTYLIRRGEDCVGNLFLGNESLQRYLQTRRTRQPAFALAARAREYPALADVAIAGDPAGSSAAGEHPKFTTVLQRGSQVRQVLVKFSPTINDRVSQRWSDLLVAEHLASKALRDIGVPSTGTELVSGGNRANEKRNDRLPKRMSLRKLPERKFEPALPGAGNLGIWPEIADRAAAYWQEVAAHELVSADFGALAAKNAESISRNRKALM